MTKSRGLIVRVPWAPWEDQVLRNRYPTEKASAIAAELHRPVHVIYSRANRLGLTKSEAFLASSASGRIVAGATPPASHATRFGQAHHPWNTGTKGVAGIHENSRRTQFKKGQFSGDCARNYVPIGTEKVSEDGYLLRKVTDDPALVPARRWEAVHRLVWIAARGPIPSGHAVVFMDGRRTTVAEDITVDILELVTRAELMRRNSYHTNYPKEVAQLIQLKGALTRKINRRGTP